MPKAQDRIQRHFPPITYRARFSPERLVRHPPSTLETMFPMVEAPIPRWSGDTSDGSSGEFSEDEVEHDILPTIVKPKGEVGRLKEGYKLREVLDWDEKTFLEVQVCFSGPVIPLADITYIGLLRLLCTSLSQPTYVPMFPSANRFLPMSRPYTKRWSILPLSLCLLQHISRHQRSFPS